MASCDEQMAEGVSAEQLDDEMFEHFFCRTVVCETSDGRQIRGDAVAYRNTKKTGGILLVDIGEAEPALIFQQDVKFIKDVTPWDEEERDA